MLQFNNIIKRIRLHTIANTARVSKILGIISVIIALATLVMLFYYHGFVISKDTQKIILGLTIASLSFFAIKYLFLLFYSENWRKFIRSHLIEGILLLVLFINFIVVYGFGSKISWFAHDAFYGYYILFLQVYFLIVTVLEIMMASDFLAKIQVTPPVLMMISFFILITLGTILLMLPRMTTDGISFVDALFTSTSASCVTGLVVVDTGTAFTLRGQVVIMLLMQFGGISILAFATFFAAFLSSSKMSIKQQHLLKDFFSVHTITDSISMLKEIVLATVIIELIGIGLLFGYWQYNGIFESNSEALFYSFFHSISAFNNAGFSLWDKNFMDSVMLHSYFPQAVVMFLIILGGMGFIFLHEIFSPAQIKERRKHRWRSVSSSTKIVISTTLAIIIGGSILFYLLERNYSLFQFNSFWEKGFESVFQIVTSRTAGFNTISMENISIPALMLIMVVMFIGASPGSTGGGIKTTTAFVIFKSVAATIRGKKYIEYQKKTIPFELVDKSYSIVVMSFLIILLSVFALAIVDPKFSFVNLLFESISAFTTCGLSSGITPKFSDTGKIILVLNMYIGRIGTLTLVFALWRRIKESQHQYPNSYFMVG